ncbi:MAG: CsgG/HfaB family protein, partial [bacterium]
MLYPCILDASDSDLLQISQNEIDQSKTKIDKTTGEIALQDVESSKGEIPSIAVLDFEARNVPDGDATAMSDRFRYELLKTRRFRVMERNQMRLILEEQGFQQSGCVEENCVVEVGQLIAVTKIVTGSISKVGGIYSVNVKMLDVSTGKIEENTVEDCDCPIEKVLTTSLKQLASKLAGLEVNEEKSQVIVQRGNASLFIKTVPSGASVYIDGKMMDGRTPLLVENLIEGKHNL